MAARDSSSKSSQRRASGGRSSAGGTARKSSSKSASKSAKSSSRGGGEDNDRRAAAKKGAASRRGGAQSRERDGAARKSASSKSASAKAPAKKSTSKSASKRAGRGEGDSGRASSRGGGARAEGGRARKSAGSRGKMDALKLLKQDHETVDEMFRKYDRMKEGDERKQALAQQICEELRVHAQIEEELFYPALKTLFEEEGRDKEGDLIEEADVEHETIKWLMEQLEGEQSDEAMRDARIKVMGEYVRHHVEEEEGQIFKAAKKVDLDLEELGRQLDARKRQLKGEEPADQEGMGDDSMQVSEPAQMATSGAS